jgi:xanthine dehydrogenase accessory factor
MVTAVEVLGSAPCAPGAKLLVAKDRIWGTVGGGNLEFTAIDQARRLAGSKQRSLIQSLPLGPMLSQCCGGRVSLLFERFEPDQSQLFTKALLRGGHFHTLLDAKSCERSHVPDTASTGPASLSGSQLVDGVWREPVYERRRQVVIFGGGHIGRALVKVLLQASCDLMVVDPRPDVARELEPFVRVVPVAATDAMDLWWRPQSVAVILTHSHALDYMWARELLRRGDAAWCGVIGSRTKRERFLRRLRADGLTEAQIERLVCPIGLPGLNSKHPGSVAISTAAQLLPLLAPFPSTTSAQGHACALREQKHILERML